MDDNDRANIDYHLNEVLTILERHDGDDAVTLAAAVALVRVRKLVAALL